MNPLHLCMWSIRGIGGYYIFSGGANFYSIIILAIGLSGILFNIYHKKESGMNFTSKKISD
ncbi:hypothetical protein J2Y03_000835 [Neobacillus niacini]|nr:hypothetical protein [Neobacillus niacini]